MVSQAHTRLYLVYILPTGTTRTEGIPRNIGGVDVNLDAVIDQRRNEYRSKRGHALALRIVGRDTHQTVHPVLAFEIAVGVIALYLYGNRLDAGLVAFQNSGDGPSCNREPHTSADTCA